jgi:hypothetical protein
MAVLAAAGEVPVQPGMPNTAAGMDGQARQMDKGEAVVDQEVQQVMVTMQPAGMAQVQ